MIPEPVSTYFRGIFKIIQILPLNLKFLIRFGKLKILPVSGISGTEASIYVNWISP